MAKINRRQFLIWLGALGSAGVGVAAGLLNRRWWERPSAIGGEEPPIRLPDPWTVEGRYYASFASEGSLTCTACHSPVEEPLPVTYCHLPHAGNYVRCNLCPHRCIVAEGERGLCRVRENQGGRLYSRVYGNPCAVHLDPIEKKPFFHFLPTAAAFSIATAGCNLRCLYCQNWPISQRPPEETQNIPLSPEDVIYYAREVNAPIIAYTYSEPIIFYEYMLATSLLARQAGLLNAVISAGFIEPDPLKELCQSVDAIKIDLKGFDENFYREVVGGELQPVLNSIETIHQMGVHLEIVNLVVPTLNDNLEQLKALSRWVARDLSPDVPLHFSRFHPQYKLTNLPATPIETLDKAREIALEEGVHYAYVGNVPGHPGNSTYCHACGRAIIVRQGFGVAEYHLSYERCEYCGEPIPGVWWPDKPELQLAPEPPGPPDQ
jgi:pyruvate formate lyase activating enzyme